jgi:hypothetical protein
MKTRNPVVCAAILFAVCRPFLAQEKTSIPADKSCLVFVQHFYDWYVPKARDVKINSIELALKERRSSFSAELVKGVEAVDAEEARTQDVGLDFDLIVNTQDPGDPGDPPYSVRNSKTDGTVCRVDVSRDAGKGGRSFPS